MTRDTETRHSANEVRETVESSITQWCWTTQWEDPKRTERHVDQGPRSGRVSQKVSSKLADQVVVNYRTGTGPATTPKQSAPQQCWSDPTSQVAVSYHMMELEEQTRREVTHDAARK